MNIVATTVPMVTFEDIRVTKKNLGVLGQFFTAPRIETEAAAVRHAIKETNDELPTQNCVTGTKSVVFDEARKVWEIELIILD